MIEDFQLFVLNSDFLVQYYLRMNADLIIHSEYSKLKKMRISRRIKFDYYKYR
jgi:hypothetical protein